MNSLDGLNNKNILLVGDDDLVSIALALTDLPSRILVLDIDKRLGNFLERVNKKYGFDIEFLEYNVSNPLPKFLLRKFHIFSSEPLETDSGFLAFLARGASCLKRNGVGYVGLTTLEVSKKRWLKFEGDLLKMNFVITDIIRNFSSYSEKYGPKEYDEWLKKLSFKIKPTNRINWYKSHLIRIEAIGLPKPLIKWNEKVRIRYVGKEDITFPSKLL
jgi:hypothetical protein